MWVQILNQQKKVIAVATKHGNLFYLEHCRKGQSVNVTEMSNEMLWHQRYGHVGEQTLKSLVNGKLVERFDYNSSRALVFVRAVSVESSTEVPLTVVKDRQEIYLS